MSSGPQHLIALLDVNVLIALIDPRHIHHDAAHRWFADRAPADWASCALTQNAVLRIVGHPRYPNSPGGPAKVSPVLRRLIAHPGHVFWPEAPSLLALPHVDPAGLIDPGQVTDTYLLALAVHHGGRLASLDQRLSTRAVRSGDACLLRIPV
ncbi:MAG: TA system VapC family ribonuclease toxin [Synechococcaceae cyanobacterium]